MILTLRDGEPVDVDLADVVNEERLHQGQELGETPWDITELTLKSGRKVQVQEENILAPPVKATKDK